jgi:hypothetical protein
MGRIVEVGLIHLNNKVQTGLFLINLLYSRGIIISGVLTKLNRIYVFVTIITLILGISGAVTQYANAQTTQIYENPLYGLKVPYPSNWIVDDTEEGEVIFAAQIGENSPSIIVQALPDPVLDQAASLAEYLKELMVSRGSTIADEKQSTVNGRDAYFFSYTGEFPWGGTFKNAAIVTQTNDFLYNFQLGASPLEEFDNLISVLDAMFLGAEFYETSRNSLKPNNNLGGGEKFNNTFQEGQRQQGEGFGSQTPGGGSDFGQGGGQFDPFEQQSPSAQGEGNQGGGFGKSGQGQEQQETTGGDEFNPFGGIEDQGMQSGAK